MVFLSRPNDYPGRENMFVPPRVHVMPVNSFFFFNSQTQPRRLLEKDDWSHFSLLSVHCQKHRPSTCAKVPGRYRRQGGCDLKERPCRRPRCWSGALRSRRRCVSEQKFFKDRSWTRKWKRHKASKTSWYTQPLKSSMFFDPVFSRLSCSLKEGKNTFSWKRGKGCSLEHSFVRECLLFIWWQILSIERQSTKVVSWLNGTCILSLSCGVFFSNPVFFKDDKTATHPHVVFRRPDKAVWAPDSIRATRRMVSIPICFSFQNARRAVKWWESLRGKKRAILHRVVLDLRRLSKRYGLCQSFKS